MKRACLLALAMLASLPTVVFADAKQDVADAFTKAMAKGRFITRMDGDNGVLAMQMRVVLPNRFHMTTPDTEMVILPQGTWMKAEGEWMQFPMDMSKMIEGYSQKNIDQGMDALTDVREIGSETVDGCDSTIYSYRTSGKFMGVESNSAAQVAICGSTGLPVRVVSLDKKGKPEATLYYDFSTDFEISAPN